MAKLDRPIKVLIVDDSVVSREVLKEILISADDINVIGEASNGLDATQKVKLLKPDLVTMDVKMPIMDGLEAVRKIMSSQPTPILVITASLSMEETDVSFGKPMRITAARHTTTRTMALLTPVGAAFICLFSQKN